MKLIITIILICLIALLLRFVAFRKNLRISFANLTWQLLLLWISATTVGEFVGFSIPAILGALAEKISLPIYGIMIFAGLGEGATLAFFQSLVLKKQINNFESNKFILYTALAAGLAWAIGMLPSTIPDLSKIPILMLIPGILAAIIVFLMSIGFAQWLILKLSIQNAGWWIVANAIAWPIGVLISILCISIVPNNSPTIVFIFAGIIGGILMGATVGLITGLFLIGLIKK